ncbi:hypothetical protein, partial [Streptomyces sp. NPDC059814]|uniref:hypothetical protein n=1 Tax=Streptomyces sp. NPDC059814 TaxID=3346959 RepID=UPI003646D9DE
MPLLELLASPSPLGFPRGADSRVSLTVADEGPTVGVDLDERGGDALQEDAVVGDGDDGAPVAAEGLLQPVERDR